MRTLAAGNNVPPHAPPLCGSLPPQGGLICLGAARRQIAPKPRASRGFTLLEMLLVVTIVAIASAGVSFALRDSSQSQLETEAQRLAALLEAARAQSRATGVPVVWRATPTGFAWQGMREPSGKWQGAGIVAATEKPLLLGPEPLIAPQTVRLWLAERPTFVLRVSTDGLRPFQVQSAVQ